jgi:methylenetetrahydrofolate--tRNA-(uracil-5-)-methyltransferase
MLGALMDYVHTPTKNFQPMNANFGIVPGPEKRPRNRQERNAATARRALDAMQGYRDAHGWLFP